MKKTAHELDTSPCDILDDPYCPFTAFPIVVHDADNDGYADIYFQVNYLGDAFGFVPNSHMNRLENVGYNTTDQFGGSNWLYSYCWSMQLNNFRIEQLSEDSWDQVQLFRWYDNSFNCWEEEGHYWVPQCAGNPTRIAVENLNGDRIDANLTSFIDIDGDGDQDMIYSSANNSSGNRYVAIRNGNDCFSLYNEFQQLNNIPIQVYPSGEKADFNNDGFEDAIGRGSPIKLFLNSQYLVTTHICGQVFNDINENGVKDNDEGGSMGVRVSVNGYASTMTDFEGNYCVYGFQDQSYEIGLAVNQNQGGYCSSYNSNAITQTFPLDPDYYSIDTDSTSSINNIDFGVVNINSDPIDLKLKTLGVFRGNTAGNNFPSLDGLLFNW